MEARNCPECGRPYGKRRRCYWCHGKQRSGENRTCAVCGKEFYAARWQLADTARNQGTYCSAACLHESLRLHGPGYEYTRQDGYVAVYYPTHPDAPQSGWVLKHRLVAEQKYERRILPWEHIHHANGVRDDNRPENLYVVGSSDHARITNAIAKRNRLTLRQELEQLRQEVAEYRRRYGPLDME